MRGLVRVVGIVGGCWFLLFVLVALGGPFVSANVATGQVGWPSRLASAGLGLSFAVPGLVAWMLAGRWLQQPPPGLRGFPVGSPDEKRE